MVVAVVDDSEELRVLARLLNAAGLEVALFRVRRGVSRRRVRDVRCLSLNIHLPRSPGVDVIRLIRHLRPRTSPTILLTADYCLAGCAAQSG
jgi:DNA-binding response OmpR family regulator